MPTQCVTKFSRHVMFATLIYLRHIKITKFKCRENFVTNLYNQCLRFLLERLKYPGKIGNNAWLRKILGGKQGALWSM